MLHHSPTIGILALQGDFSEHQRACSSLECSSLLIKRPEQMKNSNGFIIPGGESTTIWKLLCMYGFISTLTNHINQGLPVWGTCAGMILLCSSIVDGTPDQGSLHAIDIAVRRNAFGRQVDSFEERIPIKGIAEDPAFPCIFIRAPFVEKTGQQVEILGTTTSGEIVAAQQGRILVSSFHPELTHDSRFLRYFVELVKTSQYNC